MQTPVADAWGALAAMILLQVVLFEFTLLDAQIVGNEVPDGQILPVHRLYLVYPRAMAPILCYIWSTLRLWRRRSKSRGAPANLRRRP